MYDIEKDQLNGHMLMYLLRYVTNTKVRDLITWDYLGNEINDNTVYRYLGKSESNFPVSLGPEDVKRAFRRMNRGNGNDDESFVEKLCKLLQEKDNSAAALDLEQFYKRCINIFHYSLNRI